MVDFKEALKEGLTAAQTAEFARKQIREVLEEFAGQVKEVTEDKVRIHLKNVRDEVKLEMGFKTEISYWAITAFSPTKPENEKELAKWEPDPSGYPVKISWRNILRYCEDRESLEIALADLLRDPEVGQKIHSLMELGPVPPKYNLPEHETAMRG
jgi:hypothetical protein